MELQQTKGAIDYIKTEKKRFFPEPDTLFNTHFYTLIKDSAGLYAWVDGTGRLYKAVKTDTGLSFIRQDNTTHFGYNIAAFAFTYRDRIFNMGGYGLWRINGQLRVFNSKESQWDIVKLNEEVPFMFDGENSLLWYNSKAGSIYLGYASYRNESIRQNDDEIDETKYDYTVRKLDLKKMEWEKLGSLNEILKNKSILNIAMSPWGQLVLIGDKIDLIDFAHNRILVLKDNNPSYQTIVRNRYACTFYYKDSTLYFGNTLNVKVDSIPMKYSEFDPINEHVYHTEKTGILQKIGAGLLALFISVVGLWWLHKKFRVIIVDRKKVQFGNANLPNQGLVFDEKELQLLELITSNSQEGKFTSIDELNIALGITKRSVEIQKKQRSDIITSINKKYSQINSKQESLIMKQRTDFDKRSFEYFIDKSQLEVIKYLLNKI